MQLFPPTAAPSSGTSGTSGSPDCPCSPRCDGCAPSKSNHVRFALVSGRVKATCSRAARALPFLRGTLDLRCPRSRLLRSAIVTDKGLNNEAVHLSPFCRYQGWATDPGYGRQSKFSHQNADTSSLLCTCCSSRLRVFGRGGSYHDSPTLFRARERASAARVMLSMASRPAQLFLPACTGVVQQSGWRCPPSASTTRAATITQSALNPLELFPRRVAKGAHAGATPGLLGTDAA